MYTYIYRSVTHCATGYSYMVQYYVVTTGQMITQNVLKEYSRYCSLGFDRKSREARLFNDK